MEDAVFFYGEKCRFCAFLLQYLVVKLLLLLNNLDRLRKITPLPKSHNLLDQRAISQ